MIPGKTRKDKNKQKNLLDTGCMIVYNNARITVEIMIFGKEEIL